MADVTQINGLFDYVFDFIGQDLFGSIGLFMLFLIAVFVVMAFVMGAGKIFVVAMGGVLFIGLTTFGFVYIGWLAGLGFVLAGIILGYIILRLFTND